MSNLVVVTGASKGLGLGIVKELLSKSDCLVLGVARNESLLQKIQNELGSNFLYVAGDLSDDSTIKKIQLASLDYKVIGLINNAGIFEVNFFSAVAVTQTLLPQLIKNEGNVINIGSGAAFKHIQGWGPYCCTKAALHMFTKGLAEEYQQIGVLSLKPGFVDTDMLRNTREKSTNSTDSQIKQHWENLDSVEEVVQPEVPGSVIANLILKGIPKDLSGQFFAWNSDELKAFL